MEDHVATVSTYNEYHGRSALLRLQLL